MNTPWDKSQTVETLDDGVLEVSTASHGGIMVHRTALSTLPANILKAGIHFGEWLCFEEDCAANLVFAARIDLYRKRKQSILDSWNRELSRERVADWASKEGPECVARLTAALALSDDYLAAPLIESNRYWFPELFGLPPRCPNCDKSGCPGHQDQLIVVCAWGDWHEEVPEGMVGVAAVLGGRTGNSIPEGQERYHLVPKAEYTSGFFVVDPARHPVWETSMKQTTKQVAI